MCIEWTGDEPSRRLENTNRYMVHRCFSCTAPLSCHPAKKCPWFRAGAGVRIPDGTCVYCLLPLEQGCCAGNLGDSVVPSLIGMLLNTTKGHAIIESLGYPRRLLPRDPCRPAKADVQRFFDWMFSAEAGSRQPHPTRVPRLAVAALDALKSDPFVYVEPNGPVSNDIRRCFAKWTFDTCLPLPPVEGGELPVGVDPGFGGKLKLAHRFEQDSHVTFDAARHVYAIDGQPAAAWVTSVARAPFHVFDPRAKKASREKAREWHEKGQLAAHRGALLHTAVECGLETNFWSEDERIAAEVGMAKDFYEDEIRGGGTNGAPCRVRGAAAGGDRAAVGRDCRVFVQGCVGSVYPFRLEAFPGVEYE